MSGIGGWLPLSLMGWPVAKATVTDLADVRTRREERTRWMRTPHATDAAAGISDPFPLPSTLVRLSDAEIARIKARVEVLAGIGRLPDPHDLTAAAAARAEDDPPPYPIAEPDQFSEGALAMIRLLCGDLDETSFWINWATENGITE